MELTVNKLSSLVLRRLRWKALPAPLSILDIANAAGWWLVGLREWKFLEREPYSLDILADQEYILLPADLSSVISITGNANQWNLFAQASLERIQRLRIGGARDSSGYLWSLVTPTSQISGPVLGPRLEIAPVPLLTILEAGTLIYRAGWKEVGNDADHIILPVWLQNSFVEACVAHVLGVEQEAGGDVIARLERVAGLIMSSAERLDGTLVGDLGPPEGGASQQSYGTIYFNDPTYPGPSP